MFKLIPYIFIVLLGPITLLAQDNDPPQFTVTSAGTNYEAGETFSFDDRFIGSTLLDSESFTISRGDAMPLDVIVTTTGDFSVNENLSSFPDELNPNDPVELVVDFTPTAAGVRTGTLVITSQLDGASFTLNLSGEGLFPAVALTEERIIEPFESGDNYTFTDTPVGGGSGDIGAFFQLLPISNFQLTGVTVTTTGDFSINEFSSNILSTISPGNFFFIALNFLPTEIGQRTGTLTITCDQVEGNLYTLDLSGNGIRPEIQVEGPLGELTSGATFNFNDVAVGSEVLAEAFFADNPTAPLTGISVITTGDFSVAPGATLPTALEPDGSGLLFFDLIFAPSELGHRTGTLEIHCDQVEGSIFTLNLEGNAIRPEIRLDGPLGELTAGATFNFNDTAVGATISETFFAYDPSATLTGLSIMTTGDFSLLSDFPIPTTLEQNSNELLFFDLIFAPSALGNRTGTLEIHCDQVEGSIFTLNLEGNAIRPEVLVSHDLLGEFFNSGDTFNFNDTPVGAHTSEIFSVFQPTAPLTGVSIITTGDFSIDSPELLSTTLGAFNTLFIDVVFSPTELGSRTGALEIHCDQVEGSIFTLNLEGNAIAPAVLADGPDAVFSTAGVNTLEFADTQVGESSGSFLDVFESNVDLTGIEVSVTGDFSVDLDNSEIPDSFGSSNRFFIGLDFIPTGLGTRTGTLNINTDQGNVLSLTLTGVGLGDAEDLFNLAAQEAGLSGDDALPDATPFNDNVPNLLKYAFNLNLSGADNTTMTLGGNGGLPLATIVEIDGLDFWHIEFVEKRDSLLVYTIFESTSLDSLTFTEVTTPVTRVPIDDNWMRVSLTIPLDSLPDNAFYREGVEFGN